MQSALADIKYAVRTLVRSPGFTFAAVLSLALGIGANTAIFTLTNALFLNPLPVYEPSRLMMLYTVDNLTVSGGKPFRSAISFSNYEDFRDHNQALESLVADVGTQVTMTGLGGPMPQQARLVSSNYFNVLGVRPILGRFFLPDEDCKPTSVAVLSYTLWRNQFGSSRSVLGRTLVLNSMVYTIIGVGPPRFKGTNLIAGPNVVWIPISMHAQALPTSMDALFRNRRLRIANVFGRLKPGVGEKQALANLKTIAAQLEREYPAANRGRTVEIASLVKANMPPGLRDQALEVTVALTVVAALVLLLACANLATLLLARSSRRAREIGIRIALGATRARLVRQLLSESLVLAGAGGAAAMLTGWLGASLLWSFRPAFLAENSVPLHIDARVLGFTTGATLLAALLFGSVPAVQTPFTDVIIALRGEGRGAADPRSRSRLQSVLVVPQIGLAFVALIVAGLFIRSMQRAESVDPGFETRNLCMFSFDLSSGQYTEGRGRQFLQSVLEQVRRTHGVRTAALASTPPLSGGFLVTIYAEAQDDPSKSRGILTLLNTISPDYFDTLRIPLRDGRLFTRFDRDGSERVAVVSASMAESFWPEQSAVGRHFRLATENFYRQVIGVVSDITPFQAGTPAQPIAYLPLEQTYEPSVVVLARTTVNPALVFKPMLVNVQRLDPELALNDRQSMADLIAQGLWAPRMGAALFGLFGLLGAVVASAGVYGVMAYMVAQRTSEIGIRIAMGARPVDVLLLLVGHGARLAVFGVLLGIAAAVPLSRTLTGLLYNVGAQDLLTYCIVSAILGVAAVTAAWVPAHRAAMMNPTAALRGV